MPGAALGLHYNLLVSLSSSDRRVGGARKARTEWEFLNRARSTLSQKRAGHYSFGPHAHPSLPSHAAVTAHPASRHAMVTAMLCGKGLFIPDDAPDLFIGQLVAEPDHGRAGRPVLDDPKDFAIGAVPPKPVVLEVSRRGVQGRGNRPVPRALRAVTIHTGSLAAVQSLSSRHYLRRGRQGICRACASARCSGATRGRIMSCMSAIAASGNASTALMPKYHRGAATGRFPFMSVSMAMNVS